MIRQSTIHGAPASYTKITEADLYDTTSNVIGQGTSAQKAAQTALAAAHGWYITLGTGEKVLSASLVMNKRILFNTYEPGTTAGTNPCVPSTGTNRGYEISAVDGQPTSDLSSASASSSSVTTTTEPLTRGDRALNLQIPGIGGDPTLVYTPEGAATLNNQRVKRAEFNDDKLIRRIYWYENRER